MSDPTYLLWTPRILPDVSPSSSEAEVRCNVTPYAAGRFPRGPASFFERVAADLGLNERLVAWAVTPYRSSYHGDPDPGAHWTDRWKINWLVSLRFAVEDPDAFRRHGPFAEGYETWAHAPDQRADDAGTGGTATTTECRIVADFPTRAEAEQAASAVDELLRSAASSDAPKALEIFEVEARFWQLQASLGYFDDPLFQQDAPLARAAEERCRAAGGWPTFHERVCALG